jgi:hypothetical protein
MAVVIERICSCVDGPRGRFSWLFTNSASAVDLAVPIVVDGVNYGAPIENLKSAMAAAQLSSVDLWIGTGGVAVSQMVVPVIKPTAFLPVHWDDFWSPFEVGVAKPYSDPGTEAFLTKPASSWCAPFSTWTNAARSQRCARDRQLRGQAGLRIPLSPTATQKAKLRAGPTIWDGHGRLHGY